MSEAELQGITLGDIGQEKPKREIPQTRAEKRRLRREIIKQLKPPKYGPVTIYTETFEKVEGGKNVKFNKAYNGRTNIKQD